jgi:phage gpG-like protein
VASSSVTDRDLGYDNVIDWFGDLGTPAVYVGILQDKGSEMTEEGITVAGYAAVNEFGSEDGRVPERSFIRSTVDEQQADYEQRLKAGTSKVVDAVIKGGLGAGRTAMERHLGQLGAKVSRDIQQKIRDLRTPANAPSTLSRKYPGDNPLIHTGRMRQSISFEVRLEDKDAS